MRGGRVSADVPLPFHGGFAVPNGGRGRQGIVPAAGGVLSDAQNEGVILRPITIVVVAEVGVVAVAMQKQQQ